MMERNKRIERRQDSVSIICMERSGQSVLYILLLLLQISVEEQRIGYLHSRMGGNKKRRRRKDEGRFPEDAAGALIIPIHCSL